MMAPRLFAALLMLIALPVAAIAQEPPPKPWEGVWRGTVGTYPVVVCLQEDGLGTPRGAYYYLSKKVPIPLVFDKATGIWKEDTAKDQRPAPAWQLNPPVGDQLGGQWRREGRKDQRELPVVLTRVIAENGDFCGSKAFMAPRLGPIRIVRKSAKTNGLAYEVIRYDVGPQFETVDIRSFALIPKLAGDAAINRAVALDPLQAESKADFASCLSGAISNLGMDGDFSLGVTPEAVAGDYLAATEASGTYCGGAHPETYEAYRTFDRRTGQEIDLWIWLVPRAATPDEPPSAGVREIVKALRNLALRQLPPMEGECRDTIRDTDYWSVSLSSAGLGFTPSLPHVAAACENSAVLSWAALAPWLSARGKAAAARIMRR